MDKKEDKNENHLQAGTSGLSTNERMRRDWDARAEVDSRYFIRSAHSQTEDEFWQSGFNNRDKIIGIHTPRYNQILQNKNPKELKVLEIGCGIGRILIPMSKIFGEVVGVDVSEKIIEMAKKYIKNNSNCRVFQNNGSDLSDLTNDYFDFCYSFIVFQHIPEKNIVINYISEVSRVIKPGGLFRFQVFGNTKWKADLTDTWNGVHFTSEEIHQIAKDNKFKIIEESGKDVQYYWLTFKSIK